MKKIIILLSVIATFFCLVSCSSVKNIPEDLTQAQLLQLGQTAYGNGNFSAAESYFLAEINRYGSDINAYIEGKYELAHLYLKKKDYKKAYPIYTELLELYDYAQAGDLPPAFKRLSQIDMEKIPADKLAVLEAKAASKKTETVESSAE